MREAAKPTRLQEMTFALWKNITPPTGVLLNPLMNSEHRREIGRDEVAEHFVVDIPEGTSREDVIAKLVERLRERIKETDGLGFEEEWTQGIQRQFDSGRGIRLTWLSLQ